LLETEAAGETPPFFVLRDEWCHCERSEAIQSLFCRFLNCFAMLAMTVSFDLAFQNEGRVPGFRHS
jgi:hypothetical protein